MENYNKIVVADDEDMCRKVAVRICRLVAPKIEVYEVSNGRDLVEKVRQNNCAFILTDNDMPLMRGLEAVVEIRSFNPHIPICLISGGSLTEEEVYKA
ncbi:MAG: response regulator [Candidatus Pacearchaeota archaeon]